MEVLRACALSAWTDLICRWGALLSTPMGAEKKDGPSACLESIFSLLSEAQPMSTFLQLACLESLLRFTHCRPIWDHWTDAQRAKFINFATKWLRRYRLGKVSTVSATIVIKSMCFGCPMESILALPSAFNELISVLMIIIASPIHAVGNPTAAASQVELRFRCLAALSSFIAGFTLPADAELIFGGSDSSPGTLDSTESVLKHFASLAAEPSFELYGTLRKCLLTAFENLCKQSTEGSELGSSSSSSGRPVLVIPTVIEE